VYSKLPDTVKATCEKLLKKLVKKIIVEAIWNVYNAASTAAMSVIICCWL